MHFNCSLVPNDVNMSGLGSVFFISNVFFNELLSQAQIFSFWGGRARHKWVIGGGGLALDITLGPYLE